MRYCIPFIIASFISLYSVICFAEKNISTEFVLNGGNNNVSVRTQSLNFSLPLSSKTKITARVVVDAITSATRRGSNTTSGSNNVEGNEGGNTKPATNTTSNNGNGDGNVPVDVVTGATPPPPTTTTPPTNGNGNGRWEKDDEGKDNRDRYRDDDEDGKDRDDGEDKDRDDDDDEKEGRYMVDAITQATPPVNQKSTEGQTRYRKEGSLGISHKIGHTTLNGAIDHSYEDDYRSYTYNLSVLQEFNQNNTALSLGYSGSNDNVLPTGKKQEAKSSQNYDLSLTQVLTPLSQVRINLGYGIDRGYLSNPYHLVKVNNYFYPETHPSNRNKYTFTGLFTLGFPRQELLSSLQLDYRYYADDWGVESNTYGLRYMHGLSQPCFVRLEGRYYDQGQASFFKNFYNTQEQFMTSDLKLSAMKSFMFDIGLNYDFSKNETITLPFELEIAYKRYTQETGLDYRAYETAKEDLTSNVLYTKVHYKF